VLRFGAQGAEVRRLQAAFNLVPGGTKLATDGIFGAQTHSRVCSFQNQQGLVADGIVGSLTLGVLKPFLDLLDKVAPAMEAVLRERIRVEALAQHALLGWNHPMQAPPPGALNISLRRMADTTTRARQGGAGLLTILHGGGAGANYQTRALTIPAGMAAGELDPADPVNDEREYSRRRNADDILSWCGVFALHVLRRSGVTVAGWAESGGLTSQVSEAGRSGGNPPRAAPDRTGGGRDRRHRGDEPGGAQPPFRRGRTQRRHARHRGRQRRLPSFDRAHQLYAGQSVERERGPVRQGRGVEGTRGLRAALGLPAGGGESGPALTAPADCARRRVCYVALRQRGPGAWTIFSTGTACCMPRTCR
jgi:peptidoglycan hydrolase-like protein with peptidoglycan-binding domain